MDDHAVVSGDGSQRVGLRQAAFLSTKWRSNVADTIRLYGGARVFEVEVNPVDRRTPEEQARDEEKWAQNVREWKALGVDPAPYPGGKATPEAAAYFKRTRARWAELKEQGRVKGWPNDEEAERMRDAMFHRSGIGPASDLDALGRHIPREGELRVWLDNDLESRRAPEGWTHVTTASEVLDFLHSGRVIELNLDDDLGDPYASGRGMDVINFLGGEQEVHDRLVWPSEGIKIHAVDPAGRESLGRAIKADAGRRQRVIESRTTREEPRFIFEARGGDDEH